ncbi:gluconate 5-dehydrogenase [Yersinia similis]
MGVFTASLRSACSFRCKHFVNNLRTPKSGVLFVFMSPVVITVFM